MGIEGLDSGMYSGSSDYVDDSWDPEICRILWPQKLLHRSEQVSFGRGSTVCIYAAFSLTHCIEAVTTISRKVAA